MIVRDPEQRATLDDVVSDSWYKQDDHETSSTCFLSYRNLANDDHQTILRQMTDGNIALESTIVK